MPAFPSTSPSETHPLRQRLLGRREVGPAHVELDQVTGTGGHSRSVNSGGGLFGFFPWRPRKRCRAVSFWLQSRERTRCRARRARGGSEASREHGRREEKEDASEREALARARLSEARELAREEECDAAKSKRRTASFPFRNRLLFLFFRLFFAHHPLPPFSPLFPSLSLSCSSRARLRLRPWRPFRRNGNGMK